MRLLVPILLTGCYSLEAYWEDVADVHCLCTEPSQKADCVQAQMDALQDEGLIEACGEEDAPASWREMLRWRQDYSAECDLSEATPPGAENALPEACN